MRIKRLAAFLLGLCLTAALATPAGALDLEPPDPSTWPELILNQPMTLDFFGYSEPLFAGEGFDVPSCSGYSGCYRFTPVESGTYFFEILGPQSPSAYIIRRFIAVMVNGVWNDFDINNMQTITVYLEGGDECFVVAQVADMTLGSTDTFQLVARKVDPLKWWQRLPPFLQFLLRWVCFGWIWMR
jgi:hypothetical protein